MIKNILWDFDGVILDSMHIRDYGFQHIFKDFSGKDVNLLLDFHRKNGGLSRYVKIKYFFEEILGSSIDQETIEYYANKFSEIMKESLVNPDNLILDSVKYIKKYHQKFNFHIVSGSDQEELRYLCERLELDTFFLSIHGSPTPKTNLVKSVISDNKYVNSQTCLIGDSINDLDAALKNEIDFYGYNNTLLKEKGKMVKYIESLGKEEDVFNK